MSRLDIAIAILDLAQRFGPGMVSAVKAAFSKEMTEEENRETLRIWSDADARARRNAWLEPEA